MSRGEEEVDIASPLNTTGANEGASNAGRPTVSSQPANSTTRTANTQPSGPNTAPPGPTHVPAVPTRTPPAPTHVPPGPTPVPAAANRPTGPTSVPAAASRPTGPTSVPAADNGPTGPVPVPAAANRPTGPTSVPAAAKRPTGPAPVPAAANRPTGHAPVPAAANGPTGPVAVPAAANRPTGPTSVPAAANGPTGPIPVPAAANRPTGPTPAPAAANRTTGPAPVPAAANRTTGPAPVPAAANRTTGPAPVPAAANRTTGPAPVPAAVNRTTGPAPVPAAANRPTGPAPVPVAANRTTGPSQPTRTPGPVRGAPGPNARSRPNFIMYKIQRVSALRRYCVPVTTVILILASIAVIGILIKVVLDNYYFFCTKSVKFIPLDKWCDGVQDCNDNEDEMRCVQKVDFSNNSIVRLSESSSILQVYGSGQWNYICFEGFDAARAKAVCAQLGYSSNPTFTFMNRGAGPFGTIQVVGGGIEVIPVNGVCSSGNVVSLSCITCGVDNNKQRIVGGQDSPIEVTPWQVSVQYMGQHVCGGSILTPRFILCAAHCLLKNQQQVDRWRVQAGVFTLSYLFASPVDEIFIHARYELDQKAYDISMFKLKSDLSLSDKVQPICLPGYNINLPDNAPLIVTGWGRMVEGATSLSPTLQKVSINVISNALCSQLNFGVLDSMLCAGRLSGGLDTCQGDSGGPLAYLGDNSHFEQVGIVSFGDGCARPGKPGVYTRVSSYLTWIYPLMKSEL